jgi:putative flippase GtrA
MNVLKNWRIIRYLGVAVFVVGVELVTFQLVYLLLGHNYVAATILSFALAVVLNWILGRKVVFGKSQHHPAKEFTMVLVASIVGLGIQLGVVALSVQVVGLYPLIGKILSIMFSFFWNYWFRAAFIYRVKPGTPEADLPPLPE